MIIITTTIFFFFFFFFFLLFRSEHERHSPNCPFVKGEYTHNVPLSVTHATSPALMHSERAEEVAHISHTNSHQFIASATRHGSIVVWNTIKELKVSRYFFGIPLNKFLLGCLQSSS